MLRKSRNTRMLNLGDSGRLRTMNAHVDSMAASLVFICLTMGCGSDSTDSGDGAGAGTDSEHQSEIGSNGDRGGGNTGGTQNESTPLTGNGVASCDGLVTDTSRHSMTSLSKPGLHESVTDAEFGTRIVRVTDVASETGGEVLKPLYSTVQAWSADESHLVLYEVGGGHRLYDGHTYEFIRRLDINPPDLEQVYWHPRDPDVLFYADGNDLVEYSVSAGQKTVVHTFSGCRSVSAGGDPMYIAWDGQTFAFLCENTGEAFVYHLDTNTESQGIRSADLGPQVAPSGNTVYLAGDVYDGEMNFLRTLDLANPYDHASLGQYANGHDTLNIIVFDSVRGSGIGTLVVYDMTTGEDRVIIGEETGYPYPPSDTHISAVAHQAPGWVAVSVVGNSRDGREVLDNELLLADTNSGEVCRIAHHRSKGKSGPQGYWAEPHASISPSATRVLFASDWGGGATVDTYVVELPSYAP